MAKICTSCGKQVSDGAKFCKVCGAAVVAVTPRVCSKCGEQMSDSAKFCKVCGTAVAVATPRVCSKCGEQMSDSAKFCRRCGGGHIAVKAAGTPWPVSKPKAADVPVQKCAPPSSGDTSVNAHLHSNQQACGTAQPTVRTAVLSMVEQNISAPSISGETLLGSLSGGAEAISEKLAQQLTPLRTLISGGVSALKGIPAAFKSPKALLTALIAAAVWLAVWLLPSMGVEIPRWLNWLTAASCGTSGGVMDIIGGALGKGVLLSAIIGAVQMVKNKEKLKLPKLGGMKNSVGMMLIGIGLALAFGNFITGDNSAANSMVSVAACFASLKALTTGGGFVSELFNSCVTWLQNKLPRLAPINADGIKLGLSAGFALSVALSLAQNATIGFVLGAIIMVVGVLLTVLLGLTKKEVRT